MANAEQLAVLKAGVEVWNKWRKEKPNARIDLRAADLSEADLRGAYLRRANLIGAELIRANLRETNLIEADLNGANLGGARLEGADLQRANLEGAELVRVRLEKANLTETNLIEANLNLANLGEARLIGADLTGAKLNLANLEGADFARANLTETEFIQANLIKVNFNGANLNRADLSRARLNGADLSSANLTETDFTDANIRGTNWVGANISNAKISGSMVYGVNVWDLKGEFKEQKDLKITPRGLSKITVDNIKVAQFIYLILNNEEIRDVINTLTSKSVLILGRFTPERKKILDALREKLRKYDLLPIVFDFDRPTDKDFTETIKTLAGMSYFVIADITNPRSSPLELQATIPDYQIPFVPIIQEGEYPFAMMIDLQKKYDWVLDTISYDSLETLIEILKPHIIDPAIRKRDELRLIKAKEPTIISGKDLLSKQ